MGRITDTLGRLFDTAVEVGGTILRDRAIAKNSPGSVTTGTPGASAGLPPVATGPREPMPDRSLLVAGGIVAAVVLIGVLVWRKLPTP